MAIDRESSYECFCSFHSGRRITYEQAQNECGGNDFNRYDGSPALSAEETKKMRVERFCTVPHFKEKATFKNLKGLAYVERNEKFDPNYPLETVPFKERGVNSLLVNDSDYNRNLLFKSKESEYLTVADAKGNRVSLTYKPNILKRAFLSIKQWWNTPFGVKVVKLSRREVIDRLRLLSSREDISSDIREDITQFSVGALGISDISYILRFTEGPKSLIKGVELR